MVAQNKELVSMAQQFSGLPMKDLIGAPLVAAAEADNMMAMAQTKFLLETCFARTTSGDREIYKPIMINMTLTRPVINADGTPAEPVDSDFNLPLLTIIPLNSLAVDEVKVAFEMEVKSSFSSDKSSDKEIENKNNSSIGDKINASTVSAQITGVVAATEKSNSDTNSAFKKSNSAKYEISAHAAQIPLPVGVTIIIEHFSQAIAPIMLKTQAHKK